MVRYDDFVVVNGNKSHIMVRISEYDATPLITIIFIEFLSYSPVAFFFSWRCGIGCRGREVVLGNKVEYGQQERACSYLWITQLGTHCMFIPLATILAQNSPSTMTRPNGLKPTVTLEQIERERTIQFEHDRE